ncbi:3'-5' exonuclease, putative [Bodo saltans]|uniref:3'-5' exonuclease, putative n=1 Tax=Bodo saltans TaxID=75058 RepID=A0A0S4IXI6_BODSA|nr:3'-5' exonuclease, putative [Bodo saltans]|eukprot:CUF58495.1 3'-5' exonuclease, putative [Bodo saltans]
MSHKKQLQSQYQTKDQCLERIAELEAKLAQQQIKPAETKQTSIPLPKSVAAAATAKQQRSHKGGIQTSPHSKPTQAAAPVHTTGGITITKALSANSSNANLPAAALIIPAPRSVTKEIRSRESSMSSNASLNYGASFSGTTALLPQQSATLHYGSGSVKKKSTTSVKTQVVTSPPSIDQQVEAQTSHQQHYKQHSPYDVIATTAVVGDIKPPSPHAQKNVDDFLRLNNAASYEASFINHRIERLHGTSGTHSPPAAHQRPSSVSGDSSLNERPSYETALASFQPIPTHHHHHHHNHHHHYHHPPGGMAAPPRHNNSDSLTSFPLPAFTFHQNQQQHPQLDASQHNLLTASLQKELLSASSELSSFAPSPPPPGYSPPPHAAAIPPPPPPPPPPAYHAPGVVPSLSQQPLPLDLFVQIMQVHNYFAKGLSHLGNPFSPPPPPPPPPSAGHAFPHRQVDTKSHWKKHWQNRMESVLQQHPNIIPTAVFFVEGLEACFSVCQRILAAIGKDLAAASKEPHEDPVVSNPPGQLTADDTGIMLHYLNDAAEQAVEEPRTLPLAETPVAAKPCIAINFEGEGTQLRLITIATANAVFVISIEQSLFDVDSPLRALLEHNGLLKLMFDCRSNAHILLTTYGVMLRGVLDLQPMATVASSPEGEYLAGQDKVFEHFGLFGAETNLIADAAKRQYDPSCGGSYGVWSQRPLSNDLLKYCALAVQRFFLAVLMIKEFLAFGVYMSEQRMEHVHLFTRQPSNKRRDFDFNHTTFAFKTPDVVQAEEDMKMALAKKGQPLN